MKQIRLPWLSIWVLLAALAAGAIFLTSYFQERALHALPKEFQNFKLSDPPPSCGRWKEHMPHTRDPEIYHLYIEARKVWRSKIEWQLSYKEAMRILTDVGRASEQGDWGARALMAYFYRYGLGPLETNNVLKPDPVKAVELARMAAAVGQPWGLYDLGVAYEHGYGGVPYDEELAWAYYLKSAQLGSPEAQMALADVYLHAGQLENEATMLQCAYKQGHGAAAYKLAIRERAKKRYREAIQIYQEGVKFGSRECAASLELLFDGYWIKSNEERKKSLEDMGFVLDHERSSRYNVIYAALEINPDLKLGRLDNVLPLPPAKLPKWNGVGDAVEPESNDPPTY